MPSPRLFAFGAAALAAALLGPAAASAAYPTAVWPSEYQRLSRAPGASQSLPLLRSGAPNGDTGEARSVPIPFTFRFFDAPFSSLHVGAKGYLTFGGPDADTSASRALPDFLLRTATPKNLIAAWWGDHICNPDGGVRSQLLGTAPHRELVIEWDGCSKKRAAATDGSATTFQAQIRLLEGSDVIRVHYGQVEVDPAERWENVSWGIKPSLGVGALGPDANGAAGSCDPVLPQGPNRCTEAHFPGNMVIQYGRSPDADVTGRLTPGPITVDAATITLELETLLLNVGAAGIQGVGYDLFLATSPALAPGTPGTFLLGSHPKVEELAGGEGREIAERFTMARPPNGRYRLCAHLDPAEALAERDRSNNYVCSRAWVSIGPDLAVASIGGPASGGPGGSIALSYEIRNVGNADAGPFGYQVLMKPVLERGDQGVPTELLLSGRVEAGLAVGTSYQTTTSATLPPLIRAGAYVFELQLDPLGELAESDRSNNTGASGEMHNRRPQLAVTQPVSSFSLPDGCHYGEALEVSYEVCNVGESVARNFHVGVVMGEGSQPNAGVDVVAAAYPPYCGVPGDTDYAACQPIAGRQPRCAFEFCRLECESDEDCGATGLVCRADPLLAEALEREGAKSCVNELAPLPAPRSERCRTFTLEGKIPFTNQLGTAYTSGARRFHFMDDALHELSSGAPSIVSTQELLCRPALLDLAVEELALPQRLVRGKVVPISRAIRNLGFTNFEAGTFVHNERETFELRYFLSTTPDVSIRQLPLPILSGGSTTAGILRTIGRKGIDVDTDWVEIPAWIEPGTYHLGLLLDPFDQLEELDERNNRLVFEAPVVITDGGLEIQEVALPRAVVGASYHHSFVASGGSGGYAWRAENLPPGLSISGEGLLEGVPTEAGTFVFTAIVEAGGARAERAIALRIHAGMGELEVATKALPVAIKGAAYGGWYDQIQGEAVPGVRLSASGGLGPYRWELDPSASDNRLPEGIQGPTEDGLIQGVATPMSRTRTFTVRVEDSLGNQARASLLLTVVEGGALVLEDASFELATSGEDYEDCAFARGGDGSFAWEVGALPPGLAAEAGGDRLCLIGTPTVCENYAIEVRVEDGQGQSRAAALPLSVECGVIQLISRTVRPVSPGETVSFQLGAIPSESPRFHLLKGRLPAGLTLSAEGKIAGTVEEDVLAKAYDLLVELRDDAGRRSLGAVTITVVAEAPARQVITESKSGCAAAGGAGGWLALLGVAWGIVALRGRGSSMPAPAPKAEGGRLDAGGASEQITSSSARCGSGGRLDAGAAASGQVTRSSARRGSGGRLDAGAASGQAMRSSARRWVARLLSPSAAGPALGLFVLLATFACGGGSETRTLSLCEGVSCGEGSRCDELDGICKCGGVACDEGDRCVLTPSPACVSPSCELVSCDRGQSCDPETGECRCGAAVCGEGERCEREACVAIGLCEGVVCGEGASCDPADGLCRCGDEICVEGARCEDGVCTVDRCFGVQCAAHSVCDPEDGACHCGGPAGDVCRTGEACLASEEEGFGCRVSTLCERVHCGAGTICDPDDGQCRCGGVGIAQPICLEGQSCFEGACIGGDLCAPDGIPIDCGAGLACDPVDGICKCGGEGGSVCAPEEGCAILHGEPGCARRCTLLERPTICAQGESCYYDQGQPDSDPFCAPTGNALLGERCDFSYECGLDLHCSPLGVCVQTCDAADGPAFCRTVGPDLQCVPFYFGASLGYCRTF